MFLCLLSRAKKDHFMNPGSCFSGFILPCLDDGKESFIWIKMLELPGEVCMYRFL